MSRTIYCTIVNASGLPRALHLRESLRAARHGAAPDLRVLLVEHPAVVERLRVRCPDLTILGPDEVGCPEWLHMAFYYDGRELRGALKPALVRSLLGEGDVIFLDEHIEVLSSFGEIEAALGDADVLLTPYISRPLPDAPGAPSTKDILRLGQFDLGFLGVRSSRESVGLMGWWREALVEQGSSDQDLWPFSDRFWADIFPSFIDRVRVLRSPRHDVNRWNVAQRPLRWDGAGPPLAEDGPVVFASFAGSHGDAADGSVWSRLRERREASLARSPLADLSSSAYSFGTYVDGMPIPALHRKALLRMARPNRRMVSNPFTERNWMDRVVSQSSLMERRDYESLRARYLELEGRINRFPYSLIRHTGSVMNLLAPGTKDRIYESAQSLSGTVEKIQTQLVRSPLAGSLGELAQIYHRTRARMKGEA